MKIAGEKDTVELAADRLELEARARALATPSAAAENPDGVDMVRFRRGDASFVVPLDDVLNVFRPARTARLPHAPWPATALAAWRGDVLVVVDVTRARSAAQQTIAHVLVLGGNGSRVGVAADAIEVIERVAASDIHDAGRRDDNPLIRGVTDRVAAVIDAAAILRMFARSQS